MQIATLTTSRLELIAPDSQCEAAWEQFFTDGQASDAYGGAPLSASGARARLAADLGFWYLQGFGMWAIKRRDDGKIVGACGFSQKPNWPRELTWWVLPNYRGKGIAYEASRLVINHAYHVFQWSAVETYMKDSNISAKALAIRLGGIRIARHAFPDGIERDVFRLPPATAA